MNNITVIGDVNVDIVSLLREPLQLNSDTQTTNSINLGGSPCNMSMWLAHIGAEVNFLAAVGDDLLGSWINSELARGGLATANLQTIQGSPSGTCIILVGEDGQRTMLPDPGANLKFELGAAQQKQILESSVVVMSAYTFLRSETRELALAVANLVKESPTRLVLDAASSAPILEVGVQEVQEYLLNADLVLANEDEYQVLATASWLQQVPDLVVKLGPAGSKWVRFGSDSIAVPAVDVKVVDTTGAGDSYLAGLVSVLVEHHDWYAISDEDRKYALSRASDVAAKNIVNVGAGPN